MAMRAFLNCLLNEGMDVKHLCVATDKHPFRAENYPEQIRKRIQVESVYIDTRVRLLRALPYAWKRASYNVDRFKSKDLDARIQSILASNSFDVVILESLFVCPSVAGIRQNFQGKIFVRTHNVESDIWFDLAKEASSFGKRRILFKLAHSLHQYEIQALQEVDGLLSITDKDLQRFRELGIRTAAETIPVAVECGEVLSRVPDKLFHLGAMDWSPNQRAVRKLLNIFPLIQKEAPQAELHIAGRHALQHLQGISQEGVFIEDFVDDAHAYMRARGILAAPIDSGSGIRIKILEAFAQGLAVITTPKGALGLEALADRCVLICKNNEEFVKACVSLIGSEEKRQKLGNEARKYIEAQHSEALIRTKLREFLERT